MDTIVDGLINRLAQTVEQNAALILGIKDQVEDLVRELGSFQAYLTEAARNESWKDNAVVVEVEQSIRNVARDAEDAIDKYIVERRIYKAKPALKRWAEKAVYYTKVNLSAREIESFKERAKKIRQDYAHPLELLQGGSQNNHQPAVLQALVVEEDDVVGFDGEVKIIKDRLIEESKDTTFISIVGMSGLGKTTLIKKVFFDSEIEYEFFPRLWVYVSRNMNRREIFMNIIRKFIKQTNDYKNMSEEELAERIKEFLKDEKYLIVMDDVWNEKDLELLRIVFPNNQNGSRVLVTTRDTGLARHADSYGKPHVLKFLTDEESLEMLKHKVFGKEAFPTYLEIRGRKIAAICNGLPLAILVIAGVLNKDQVSLWNDVAQHPMPILNCRAPDYNNILRLSYNQLPYHTKDCFLYLAAFPIGHEISVWKLIRLWIAEGFIPAVTDSTMERIADSYLKEIVSRNLLMVVKRRADGDIKTCRLNDTLHEFCKDEAAKNYLFHEINGARIEGNDNYRRLCVRSSLKDFIGSEEKPSGEHIRSLLTSHKLDVPKEHLATIPKSYPFLKVFDAESLKFEILPKEFYQLYQLRYWAISTENNIIPKLFTHLWNLQTLMFNTTSSTVDVKAEIWNMPKLRHILSNASLQLPHPNSESCKENSSSSCPELQTLSTISPKSCTEEIFDKTPNLQKLGVRGNVSELLESKESGRICLFDNIRKLEKLENLKLMHEAFNDEAAATTLRSIPQAEKFPPNLRKLTLSKTSFDWKDICTLGSLDKLEVLKLEEFSAKGESWELNVNVVFKSLQFLRIGRTDLVYWTCEQSSFPALKRLQILQCEQLKEVPLSFKDVKSLKIIDLFFTNKQAANSARNIRDQKPKLDNFVLSILPPHH
ncbi:putative late blight resistance protein homolog R1A-3 [Ipomoea triloba]|uniref:putative late blight resistance protein homolog R1A-3 n=1 Tax=Ipomoea triloba TaxID=35885 RepID=UPI00125E94EC|nr:putative late blight resistance protein homolog R1A-3 [Ipomoea triloba]